MPAHHRALAWHPPSWFSGDAESFGGRRCKQQIDDWQNEGVGNSNAGVLQCSVSAGYCKSSLAGMVPHRSAPEGILTAQADAGANQSTSAVPQQGCVKASVLMHGS